MAPSSARHADIFSVERLQRLLISGSFLRKRTLLSACWLYEEQTETNWLVHVGSVSKKRLDHSRKVQPDFRLLLRLGDNIKLLGVTFQLDGEGRLSWEGTLRHVQAKLRSWSVRPLTQMGHLCLSGTWP
ncbi:hypothetical protein SKAU_G00090210 [Synaphobranchus kaupii]|uniref:Uncharacterized protein n=1 Tax=Synaphobranchus kaupii TaxID=118154 RepID=A0A9Q1FWC9_SYNKA|nr:hypothetical protein SKAU_G00090210 [Synaphobranchus kaupii]